jgi:formamidopyrimidine-DNA glycosylase
MVRKIQPVSFAVLKTAAPPYSDLQGKAVSGVQRFGKFVSLEADGLHFVFHLARAGWVRFTDSPTDAQLKMGKGHIALRLTFSGDSGPVGMDLTEAGTKKSLAAYVVRQPSDVKGIASLGPDPLADEFGVDTLAGILAKAGRAQVKGVLRHQGTIAGIGNAYSDEVLHAARLSPFKPASSLDEGEVQTLHDAIRSVIGAAVDRSRGLAASELKGEKKSNLAVHGRTGQKCPVCGDVVREVSFADSSLQYCATCQTGGKPLADRRMSKLLK